MKVLLLDAPYRRLMGSRDTPLYPLGMAYLSAELNHAAHDSRYVVLDHDPDLPFANALNRKANIADYEKYKIAVSDVGEHSFWDEVRRFVTAESPDVVGMTGVTPKMRSVLKLARVVKECGSNIRVILGGHHPGLLAREIIQNCEYIDAIVKGEGDDTFVEYIHALEKNGGNFESLKNIAGLFFRGADGKVVETPNRALMMDLDSLPFPESAQALTRTGLSTVHLTALMGSRGCPYHCSYCATNNIWERRVRRRSVDNVIDELKFRIRTQGTRYFTFWDDCFTLDKKWSYEFCDKVLKEKLNVNFDCCSSASLVDEDLFRRLVQAGCNKISLGIESGSERILATANRSTDLSVIKRVVGYTKKYGVSISGLFMIGFPEETIEDVRKTQNLMRELNPNWAYVNVLIPLPGTKYYTWVLEHGLLDEKQVWSGEAYTHNQINYTGTIDDVTFNGLVDETYDLCFRINRSLLNLWKRVPLQEYVHNPAGLVSDAKRFASWLMRK